MNRNRIGPTATVCGIVLGQSFWVTVHGANVPFYVIARSAAGGPWQSQSLHFRLLRRKTPRNDPKDATYAA